MAEHVCPIWVGYLLASPVRRLLQNPEKILSDHVRAGMTVLDIGSAMGFFSIPLAKMVGRKGRVICVDMQEKMIRTLEKRAKKAQVLDRIETRLCSSNHLKIDDQTEKIDFALAFAVIHETPDASIFLTQIHQALKPGGQLLIAEPKGHVPKDKFEDTLQKAQLVGFKITDRPRIARSHTAICQKSA